MAARHSLEISAFREPPEAIGACGVKEAIARHTLACIDRYQGLGDQTRQNVLDWLALAASNDPSNSIQSECAGKYRQLSQDRSLICRQKLIAPVERRRQGLMPGESRPP